MKSRFEVIINAKAISGTPLRFALTYIRAVLFGCRFPADEDTLETGK